MIVDSMDKLEVYFALLNDFKNEILPGIIKREAKWLSLFSNRSLREKRTIILPIIEITSSNRIQFHILIKGYGKSYSFDVIAEFDWKGKKCFAMFFRNNSVTVFTKHSLDRYSERVLQKDTSYLDIIFNHLYKGANMSYQVALPSRTHKYTLYYSFANGLFFGDAEDSKYMHDTIDGKWYNTCISFNEAGLSQMMIMTCMKQMYDSAQALGYVPLDSQERCITEILKGTTRERYEHMKRTIFIEYLLLKVQKSFNYPYLREEYYKSTERFLIEFCYNTNVPKKEFDKFISDRFDIIKREIEYIEILKEEE